MSDVKKIVSALEAALDADTLPEELIDEALATKHAEALELVAEAVFFLPHSRWMDALEEIVADDNAALDARIAALSGVGRMIAALEELDPEYQPDVKASPMSEDESQAKIATLVELSRDESFPAELRRHALEVAANIWPKHDDVVAAAEDAAGSKDPEWQSTALLTMALMEHPDVRGYIAAALTSGHEGLFFTALRATGLLGDDEDVDTLSRHIFGKNEEHARHALWCLAECVNSNAGGVFVRATEDLPEPLRDEAEQAYELWLDEAGAMAEAEYAYDEEE